MKIFILSIIGLLWMGCNEVPSVQDGYKEPEGTQAPFRAEKKQETKSAKSTTPDGVKPLISSKEPVAITTDNDNELEENMSDQGSPIDNLVDMNLPLPEDVDVDSEEELATPLPKAAPGEEEQMVEEQMVDTNFPEQDLVEIGPPLPEDIDVDSEEELATPLPKVVQKEASQDGLKEEQMAEKQTNDGMDIDVLNNMSFEGEDVDEIGRAVEDSVNTLVNNVVHPEVVEQADIDISLPTQNTETPVHVPVTEVDNGETETPSQDLAYVDHTSNPDDMEMMEDDSSPRDTRFTTQVMDNEETEEERFMWIKNASASIKSAGISAWYSLFPELEDDDSTDSSRGSTDQLTQKSETIKRQGVDHIGRSSWLTNNQNEDYFLFEDDLYGDVFAGWYQIVDSRLSALMILKIEEEHVLRFQEDANVSRGDLMDMGIYDMYANWTNKHILCVDGDEDMSRFQGSLVIFNKNSDTPLTYGDYMLDVDEFKQGYAKLKDRQSGEELLLSTLEMDSDPLSSLENSVSMFSYFFKNRVTSIEKANASCE